MLLTIIGADDEGNGAEGVHKALIEPGYDNIKLTQTRRLK